MDPRFQVEADILFALRTLAGQLQGGLPGERDAGARLSALLDRIRLPVDQADPAVMAAQFETWYALLADPVYLGHVGVAGAAWKRAYADGYLQRGLDEALAAEVDG